MPTNNCLVKCCSLNRNTGELAMKGKVREGDYTFQVSVYDKAWKRDVVSSVTVRVQDIGDDAVYSSGSIRLSGKDIYTLHQD